VITTGEPAGADPPHGHRARSDPDALVDIEVDNRPAWSDRDRLVPLRFVYCVLQHRPHRVGLTLLPDREDCPRV
jgi:hypothetical protein